MDLFKIFIISFVNLTITAGDRTFIGENCEDLDPKLQTWTCEIIKEMKWEDCVVPLDGSENPCREKISLGRKIFPCDRFLR